VSVAANADGSVTASYRETVMGSYVIGMYYRLTTGRGDLIGDAATAVTIVANRVSVSPTGTVFALPQFDGTEAHGCVPQASCSYSSTLEGDCGYLADPTGGVQWVRCGLAAAGQVVRASALPRDRYGNPSVIGVESLQVWFVHETDSDNDQFPGLDGASVLAPVNEPPQHAGVRTDLIRRTAECFRVGGFDSCGDGTCVPTGQPCSERGERDFRQLFSGSVLAVGNHTLYAFASGYSGESTSTSMGAAVGSAYLVKRERLMITSAAMLIDEGGTKVRVTFRSPTNRARMGMMKWGAGGSVDGGGMSCDGKLHTRNHP